MTRVISFLQNLFPLLLGASIGFAGLQFGAHLYADGAPPGIVLTQPSTGSSVSGTIDVSAAADGPGLAGVRLLANNSDIAPEITSGNCAASWNTRTSPDGVYTLTAFARTADGRISQSPPVVVTVSNDPLRVFDVKVFNLTATGATITWSTTQPSDSQINFGTASTYGQRTSLDTPAVTVHTQVLAGLVAGTTYHFAVSSRNGVGSVATSDDQTFVTVGLPRQPAPPVDPVLVVPVQPQPSQPQPSQPQPNLKNLIRISDVFVLPSYTSVTITWTTDRPATSQVDFGQGLSLSLESKLDDEPVIAHTVTLTGLQYNMLYMFRVRSRGTDGREVTSSATTFRTRRQGDDGSGPGNRQ